MSSVISRNWSGHRWILRPLIVFLVTRIVGGVFLTIGAGRQIALTENINGYEVTSPTEASPGYLGVVSNWDGQWYRSIAESGYPTSLPMAGDTVLQNEWAFAPGYPMVVRTVMAVTPWDFPIAASIVSLFCSAAAVILLYRLLARVADQFVATTAVIGVCCFPTAPILQVAYTESLALLLLVLSLTAMHHRRYGWLALAAVALELTRPMVLPLAAVVAIHGLLRWRRRAIEPFPGREALGVAGVAVFTACLSGLWPALAWLVTGVPRAYTQTMKAWPSPDHLGLLGSWLIRAFTEGGLIAMLVAIVLLLCTYAALRPGGRTWGPELRVWAIAYPLYIFIATRPSSSVVRHLLLVVGPLWPLPDLAPAGEESRKGMALRWGMPLLFAAAGIVGQYFWVMNVFTIDSDPTRQPFP
jgi:hypothetical protein